MFYEEWNRTRETAENELEEEKRLMFGLIFSMKEFIRKLSSKPPIDGLRCFKTDSYICHHFETATGLKFIMTTNKQSGEMHPTLRYIYSNIFVEYVVKNPLYIVGDGQPIRCKLFAAHLRQYIESLACFRT